MAVDSRASAGKYIGKHPVIKSVNTSLSQKQAYFTATPCIVKLFAE